MSFEDSRMRNWTQNQVLDWIHSLVTPALGEHPAINQATFDKISENFDDLEVRGQDVFELENYQELADLVQISKFHARRIFGKLVKRRNEEQEEHRDDEPEDEEPEDFKLNVGKGGQQVTIDVNETWTVRRCLEALNDIENFIANRDISKVTLYSGGVVMDHNATLASHGIRDSNSLTTLGNRYPGGASKGSDMILMKNFNVKLVWNNKTYSLKNKFIPTNSVKSLKREFLKQHKIKNKIKDLNILCPFGILKKGSMNLYVQSGNSKFQLNANPNEKINLIKLRIQDMKKIKANNQVLIFGGKVLKDDLTLNQLKIQKGSCLFLKLKKYNMSKFSNNFKYMENSKVLKDYGIFRDITLKLEIKKKEKKWKIPLKKLDEKSVKEYFRQFTLTETSKKFDKQKVTGKDLGKFKSPEELSKKLGLDMGKAKFIFNKINEQKKFELLSKEEKIKEKKKLGENFKNIHMEIWDRNHFNCFIDNINFNNKNINKNLKKRAFDFAIFGGDLYNCKNAEQICQFFFDEPKSNKNIKLGDLIMKELEKIRGVLEKKFSLVNIKNQKEEKKEEKKFRVRRLNLKKYKSLRLSKKPCCIMGYDDSDGYQRAQMGCSHAITPESMFNHIERTFTKDEYSYKILCPVKGCKDKNGKKTEWDWKKCTKVADFDKDEVFRYFSLREKRKMKDFKDCPHCGSLCKRNHKSGSFKTKCLVCNKSEWCWFCRKVWKGKGNSLCGNKNCQVVKNLNSLLQGSKLSTHDGIPGVPEMRACPKCLNIINRVTGCKYMRCLGCGYEFCFFCLAYAPKHVYTCKIPKGKNRCEIYPRQQF